MSGGHHHADVLRWILDPLLTVPLGLALLLYVPLRSSQGREAAKDFQMASILLGGTRPAWK